MPEQTDSTISTLLQITCHEVTAEDSRFGHSIGPARQQLPRVLIGDSHVLTSSS